MYQNPWGPGNPQSQASTGFAPWVFDLYNPPTNNPPTSPFFIDTTRGAWGINVVGDIVPGTPGYDAAWISFTGDGYLDPGQKFSTTVLYTPTGAANPPENPAEGIDFFAQAPGVPSRYDTFGHQVLGIYLGPNSFSTSTIILVVHTTLSDENRTS